MWSWKSQHFLEEVLAMWTSKHVASLGVYPEAATKNVHILNYRMFLIASFIRVENWRPKNMPLKGDYVPSGQSGTMPLLKIAVQKKI